MSSRRWPHHTITADDGERRNAILPVVISASRSTDIPAFYGEWFMRRLYAGYVRWVNPWNGRASYVSFESARVFVFWSKNPKPFLPFLDEIHRRGYHTLFQVTVNDYEAEGMEPLVPPLTERVATVKRLAAVVGKERVLWRYDPLFATRELSPPRLVERVKRVGDLLAAHVGRLTVSFLDDYASVRQALRRAGVRRLDSPERVDVALRIAGLAAGWGIPVVTCAEAEDFCGIGHGSCIDGDLMARLFPEDAALRAFLRSGGRDSPSSINASLKDPGQRKSCRCILGKDIGSYGTCGHGCIYCYAGGSRRFMPSRDPAGDSLA